MHWIIAAGDFGHRYRGVMLSIVDKTVGLARYGSDTCIMEICGNWVISMNIPDYNVCDFTLNNKCAHNIFTQLTHTWKYVCPPSTQPTTISAPAGASTASGDAKPRPM